MDISVRKLTNTTTLKQLLHTNLTKTWNEDLQSDVLLYTAEMLQEGFSLLDTMTFIQLIYPKHSNTFKQMTDDLTMGDYFFESTKHINLPSDIRFQIEIAEKHTDFPNHLATIAAYLKDRSTQKKKLIAIMFYPLSLFTLILLMLFGIRWFMLPQLNSLHTSPDSQIIKIIIWFLTNYPYLLFINLCLGLGSYIYYKLWKKRVSPLQRARFIVKLPIIGYLFKLYYTYFFGNELGQLLNVGYSLQQVALTFQNQTKIPLLNDIGTALNVSLQNGQTFPASLESLHIFTNEFPAIILQGEVLHGLGIKTKLYAKRCLAQLYRELSKQTKVIQNILFLWVALTVITVYLILMLPMLTMIGGL